MPRTCVPSGLRISRTPQYSRTSVLVSAEHPLGSSCSSLIDFPHVWRCDDLDKEYFHTQPSPSLPINHSSTSREPQRAERGLDQGTNTPHGRPTSGHMHEMTTQDIRIRAMVPPSSYTTSSTSLTLPLYSIYRRELTAIDSRGTGFSTRLPEELRG